MVQQHRKVPSIRSFCTIVDDIYLKKKQTTQTYVAAIVCPRPTKIKCRFSLIYDYLCNHCA